jgi:hypothetical protein
MMRLFKALLFLSIAGFIGVTGYAYLGDMNPQSEDINQPVSLDGN